MKTDSRTIGRELVETIGTDEAGRRAFLRDGSILLLAGLTFAPPCLGKRGKIGLESKEASEVV